MNRFTSDVASIDGQLMIMLGWLALTMSFLFFNLVSIAISTNGVMLILLLPVTIIFVKIFEYVRCSTTAVKRITSTSLSPVYSVFTETLVGIRTIRAYRQQARFIDQNADMLTLCSRPQIIEGYISVWLSVQLGLCGAAISSGCFLIILWWPEFVSPGLAGLALSFSTGLVQTAMHVVNLSAQLEVELNSVERLRHYITQLPREKYQPEKSHRTEWRCDRGTVKLKNVQLRYRDGPLVLKGVNADIASHEKVGIVGRTGSGKSTLLIALFRIEELVSGSILIDDVDISELPLQTLRSMLCMVPQDPVMFGESLRFNLDPFDAHSDDQIWAALRAVQMETYVQNTQGALMHNVEEGGSNFSVGQRQLLCFARALLREPRFLVLDEATASIDQDTDEILQQMIRDHFSQATVLTIAHRLNTVMDSDRIMVMDNGVVAEFDKPATLLNNDSGILKGMVEAQGAERAAVLHEIANAQ